MTEQLDKPTGDSAWPNGLWLSAAVLLVLAGLAGFYLLNTQPMPLRVTAVVAGIALGLGAASLAPLGRAAWQFALDSRVELRKMVWPTGQHTRRMTAVVIAFVVLLGLFFWAVDWLLALGTRHLLGTGA
jgi:preprotein translocase subunit SecE